MFVHDSQRYQAHNPGDHGFTVYGSIKVKPCVPRLCSGVGSLYYWYQDIDTSTSIAAARVASQRSQPQGGLTLP